MTFDTTTILIIAAVLAVLIVGFLLMRRGAPKPIERKPAEPYVASQDRPYMRKKDGPEGNGVADEVAAAATDVAGEVLGVDAHRQLGNAGSGTADDLVLLKGVGPKLAAKLNELGVTRFAQIAGMNETEIAHLDERMGPFRGRLVRDRIAEQADYLARGDIESFEERFGKLGSEL